MFLISTNTKFIQFAGNIQVGLNDNNNGFVLAQTTKAVCPVQDNEGTLRADDYNGDDVGDVLCHNRNGDIKILYGKEGMQKY